MLFFSRRCATWALAKLVLEAWPHGRLIDEQEEQLWACGCSFDYLDGWEDYYSSRLFTRLRKVV